MPVWRVTSEIDTPMKPLSTDVFMKCDPLSWLVSTCNYGKLSVLINFILYFKTIQILFTDTDDQKRIGKRSRAKK